MSIQNDDTIVTKGDLKNLYADKIAPYLGANIQLRVGANDYFSTDEKIVGVWNGKPVYQKTVDCGTMPRNTGKDTSYGDFVIDTLLRLDGVARIGDELFPLPYLTDVHEYELRMELQMATKIIRTKSYSTGWSEDSNVYVTMQYTKTSDTANSAATTVGCYDSTRPDQWLENTEIYFGNGLYGYRATGTRATNGTPAILVNTVSKLVSQGGEITYPNWVSTPCPFSWNGDSCAMIFKNGSNNLCFNAQYSSAVTISYDIWALYRK